MITDMKISTSNVPLSVCSINLHQETTKRYRRLKYVAFYSRVRFYWAFFNRSRGINGDRAQETKIERFCTTSSLTSLCSAVAAADTDAVYDDFLYKLGIGRRNSLLSVSLLTENRDQ